MNEQEQQAVIGVGILAAFADGAQTEVERARIKQIVEGFSNEHLDLTAAYQEVLGGQRSLAEVASPLQTPAGRMLAYEMAVCICDADGELKEAEKQFLADLRHALQLEAAATAEVTHEAGALAREPLTASGPAIKPGEPPADLDRMILNYAILNGALEIMPHSLATLAIVPLQMRMVYRIGRHYGYELGRGHIKDFLATVGIGLTSQVFEGFAQRLIGGLTRPLVGRLVGGLAGQAAGSVFAFATTYALGQVAKRYYASGRTLEPGQLKEVFASMLTEARSVQSRYTGDIAQKSRQVNVTELLPLVKQS